MNDKLSIIIPYVNEWPSIVFTIRSVAEQFIGKLDFEIIAIDNYCEEVSQQNRTPDRGHDFPENKNQISHIKEISKKHPWLTYVKYTEKLSHWNAKNLGVHIANGSTLLFLDAHVIPSRNYLLHMYYYYVNSEFFELSTLHSVLSYHILETKRLIYSLKHEENEGFLDYRFSSCPEKPGIAEVPCMSTCGMMMSSSVFQKLNGWPKSLGIYGGGENYFNFVSSILGIKKYIYNTGGTLYHHGDKRGYHWNYNDYHTNKLIATYLFGGKLWAQRYLEKRFKIKEEYKEPLFSSIIDSNIERRIEIKKQQVISIEDWLTQWK